MTTYQVIAGIVAVSACLFVTMAGAWLIWRRTGNSGWIDTVWTFSVGVIGCLSALAPIALFGGWTSRQLVVAFLAIFWSLRLGVHIASRTKGITDDPRYAKLAHDWGADAPRQMFWLCEKQAIVSIPLVTAIMLAAWNPLPGFRFQDALAVFVLLIGIGGEFLADSQLRQFRRRSTDKSSVCDTGLWAWSRHPNYFFEWLGWFSYPLFAIDLAGGYPWGWLALSAPACMYWLLVHVSGIPPLEAHMLERRGDSFRAYQRRTNAFFPAPPRTPDAATS